ARRELALSFGIFALSMLIGALSSAMDSEFVNVILSEEYVEMTKRNIESGDPMAVYKGRGQLSMSMGITVNNLMVAFLTFATGAFFTLGSIVVLIRNGIMVGAFQYFFIERGLFWESFLTIWIHGTLEISAIIIAGAAGITVGKGLVFPGAYRRMQAFQRSARRGLKIMVGIAPIIILAGFIEGFLTRFTETPDVVRGAFIAACFAFVIFYFVWYPWSKAVKGFTSPVRDAQIPPDSNLLIDMNVIKSNGDIFSETFTLAKKNAGRLFIGSLVVALAYAAVAFPLAGKAPAAVFQFPQGFMAMLYKVSGFFRQADLLFLPLVGIAAMLAWSLIAFRWVDKETGLARKLRFTDILMPLPGVLLVWLLFFSNDWYTWLLLLFAAQMALLWAYTAYRERMDPIRAIGRMFGHGWPIWAYAGFVFDDAVGERAVFCRHRFCPALDVLGCIDLGSQLARSEYATVFGSVAHGVACFHHRLPFCVVRIGLRPALPQSVGNARGSGPVAQNTKHRYYLQYTRT
ncbi:MAG TPA: stage II sporulation protein M, partial [Saprospiraceae bacterium]|nr:stage II sporulation protein M [Saprospiraceae bacterium]